MPKKLITKIKERNKKINRRFAGKKSHITKDYNKKLRKLLNNQGS